MPYPEPFAERVRDIVGGRSGVTEKKMFGGIGWMINGNMACGVMSTGELLVRLGHEESEQVVLQEPGARLMEQGWRAMRGFIMVDTDTLEADAELARWVDCGADFAASLPPK